MKLSHFLHIYQPADQQQDILERVVHESYRPLVDGLKSDPGAKITLNINAALTEMLFERGFRDVVDGLKFLAERGQIEFTGSAKYHAFLPLLPPSEIERQIAINIETNRYYFGEAFSPKGFFAPEMAYSQNIIDAIGKFGYQWIIIDEIAFSGKNDECDFSKLYTIKGSNITAVFRERKTSNVIMSAVVRSAESLRQVLQDEMKKDRYILTAMDGETFGHHRPGHHAILFEILKERSLGAMTVSELMKSFPGGGSITPKDSTWASSEENLEKGTQFFSWRDPDNIIHKWQWELLYFVLDCFYAHEKAASPELRKKMDESLASDQFWWASAKPWWSLEMIELGAWRLFELLRSMHNVDEGDIAKGHELYSEIVLKAFEWQRTGYIKELAKNYQTKTKIPFKDRTVGEGKPEVFDAFIHFMREKMQEAASRESFERAILWRDAIWKLETKNDIYDAIHATDLLRAEVPDEDLRKLMDVYKEGYRRLKGGQPEQRV
jgi:hypothetical protein